MNRSLELIFAADGTVQLNLEGTVQGFAAVVQNALVNLLTDRDRDPWFPERGTYLLQRAVASGLGDRRSAAHQANFAASSTLFFSRETELADRDDQIADLRLEPTNLNLLVLELQASFTAVNASVLSFPVTNPVF